MYFFQDSNTNTNIKKTENKTNFLFSNQQKNVRPNNLFPVTLSLLKLIGFVESKTKTKTKWKIYLFKIYTFLSVTSNLRLVFSELMLLITDKEAFVSFFFVNFCIIMYQLIVFCKNCMIIINRKKILKMMDMCSDEIWSKPRNREEEKLINYWWTFSRYCFDFKIF